MIMAALLALSACSPAASHGPEAGPVTNSAPAAPTTATPTTATPTAASSDAVLYAAVLRRYLSSPSENSFPARFPVAYVVDRTDADAADPMRSGGTPSGPRITAADQAHIVAALRDVTRVVFVADRSDVVVVKDGCAQVRDGGIVVQLAPPDGGKVGVFGFVACLGATWLTYVAERDGDRWTVTGTTGAGAIA